ncbi:hypothetical protein [Trujillonella endophytica]|uniref:Uncharacterized protein n=1 Tax=Trujillonella endophytica TaxID=673521 RepID=A0A1H8PET1_9ACTN|nr:hypothetical protein [Trujillella endophytica]SEO40321.1 hypothetical protein SAMN05660991_00135 [Trujillella endophytica]
MTRIRAALSRARDRRAHLRQERALVQAAAGAPTLESAHEISALASRR